MILSTILNKKEKDAAAATPSGSYSVSDTVAAIPETVWFAYSKGYMGLRLSIIFLPDYDLSPFWLEHTHN